MQLIVRHIEQRWDNTFHLCKQINVTNSFISTQCSHLTIRLQISTGFYIIAIRCQIIESLFNALIYVVLNRLTRSFAKIFTTMVTNSLQYEIQFMTRFKVKHLIEWCFPTSSVLKPWSTPWPDNYKASAGIARETYIGCKPGNFQEVKSFSW